MSKYDTQVTLMQRRVSYLTCLMGVTEILKEQQSIKFSLPFTKVNFTQMDVFLNAEPVCVQSSPVPILFPSPAQLSAHILSFPQPICFSCLFRKKGMFDTSDSFVHSASPQSAKTVSTQTPQDTTVGSVSTDPRQKKTNNN